MEGTRLFQNTHPAFLFWDLRALSFRHNTTLLWGNVFTDLILDSLALLLIDNITLRLSVGGALLLHHGLTFILIPCGTLLIILSRALLLMNSFLNSSWDIDTLQLWDIVALLILNSVALLPGVLSSLTVLPVLDPALLTGDWILNRSLSDLTLTLLDISTDGIWNITALLPGDRLIGSLGNLVAHFLGDLSAYWLWGSSWSRSINLKGHFHKRKNKCYCNETPHDWNAEEDWLK